MRSRALLLSLLAVLHLVVQPLAAHAYCAVIGTLAESGCCCAAVDADVESCCAPVTDPDAERQGDCDCDTLRDPLPAKPVGEVEQPSAERAWLTSPLTVRTWPVPRALCDGPRRPSAPPPRGPTPVLLQTFRL